MRKKYIIFLMILYSIHYHTALISMEEKDISGTYFELLPDFMREQIKEYVYISPEAKAWLIEQINGDEQTLNNLMQQGLTVGQFELIKNIYRLNKPITGKDFVSEWNSRKRFLGWNKREIQTYNELPEKLREGLKIPFAQLLFSFDTSFEVILILKSALHFEPDIREQEALEILADILLQLSVKQVKLIEYIALNIHNQPISLNSSQHIAFMQLPETLRSVFEQYITKKFSAKASEKIKKIGRTTKDLFK